MSIHYSKKANTMAKILGYIAYEGPSEIDGAPIVVIINKIDGSANAKTGAIVQSFIIRSDVNPVQALQNGADASICGQCEHRPVLARKTGKVPCYVQVAKSVLAVYNAYLRGRYVRADAATGAPFKPGALIYYDPATKRATLAPVLNTITLMGERGPVHFIRNARGRCEDAPCCGCCTI